MTFLLAAFIIKVKFSPGSFPHWKRPEIYKFHRFLKVALDKFPGVLSQEYLKPD